MEDYLQRRDELINEDRSRRIDYQRAHNASSLEVKADTIVRRIRAFEAQSIWGVENQSAEDNTHIFPGMAFLTSREIIVKTRLFRIMSKMPKGALLHVHADATVNAERLLHLALQHTSIHVRTSDRVTSSNVKTQLPEFRPLSKAEFTGLTTSVTDSSYIPNSWVSIQNARDHFDPDLGGSVGFDKWVIGSLTINPSEAYGTHNTTSKIWDKFASTFGVSKGLIRYAPVWSEYIRAFLLSSIEDGILYVETRMNFLPRYMYNTNGEETVPHREWLLAFDRVQTEIIENLKSQGREADFIGSKIIYSTIRNITSEELEWNLEDCISLKKEFPHLIAGFDLVGHEDSLKPLIDYVEPLTRFQERQKELGLDIPFIFHAGETLGDGTAADSNLYDAILLGTKRIGHGFSLVKHPKLMEICREKDIAVEVCPISNEILRLTTSMPMHPLPIMVNHGMPVALCSDDPAAFGNMGLSFDFFQVLVASEVTGLAALGEIARDSIKHSTLNDEQKKRAFIVWERQWKEFINWIVQEEASLLGEVLRN